MTLDELNILHSLVYDKEFEFRIKTENQPDPELKDKYYSEYEKYFALRKSIENDILNLNNYD